MNKQVLKDKTVCSSEIVADLDLDLDLETRNPNSDIGVSRYSISKFQAYLIITLA